jgi:hypothetical protein
MDALLIGKLVIVKNCLRVEDNAKNNYLLIWPKGFSINREVTAIEVYDSKGNSVAKVGDHIEFASGEASKELFADFITLPFPTDCSGPYWVIGDIEK